MSSHKDFAEFYLRYNNSVRYCGVSSLQIKQLTLVIYLGKRQSQKSNEYLFDFRSYALATSSKFALSDHWPFLCSIVLSEGNKPPEGRYIVCNSYMLNKAVFSGQGSF